MQHPINPDNHLATPGKQSPALSKEVPVGATQRTCSCVGAECCDFCDPPPDAAYFAYTASLRPSPALSKEVPVGATEVPHEGAYNIMAQSFLEEQAQHEETKRLLAEAKAAALHWKGLAHGSPSPLQTQGRWGVYEHRLKVLWTLSDESGTVIATFDNPEVPHRIAAAHNASLKDDKSPWIMTSVTPPTEIDDVVLVCSGDQTDVLMQHWRLARNWQYWMPIPSVERSPVPAASEVEEEKEALCMCLPCQKFRKDQEGGALGELDDHKTFEEETDSDLP